jgi:predicted RNA-binding Zn-ribbon protein involved in translation (DUF1610 family)
MNTNGITRCPRCGTPMIYLVEKEKNGKGEARITRYFRCPVCGTKIIDEVIMLRPVNGSIQVYTLPVAKRIIYASRRLGRTRPRRNGSSTSKR